VREHRADYSSNAKAVEAVAQQKGGGRESLRRWMTASERERVTSDETAENKRLRRM